MGNGKGGKGGMVLFCWLCVWGGIMYDGVVENVKAFLNQN